MQLKATHNKYPSLRGSFLGIGTIFISKRNIDFTNSRGVRLEKMRWTINTYSFTGILVVVTSGLESPGIAFLEVFYYYALKHDCLAPLYYN